MLQDTFDWAAYQQALQAPEVDFDTLRQRIWQYQYQHNAVVRAYCDHLGTDRQTFMPIAFFKRREMKTGVWTPQAVFESSGTSGQEVSRHPVRDLALYDANALRGFFHFFPRQSYRILALLPSYLERGHSSLVHMVRGWIDTFGLPGSGFYIYDFAALRQALAAAVRAGEPILLIGVSYALLDFAETHPVALPPDAIVMETGGMKGRREELIRDELHARLRAGLGVAHIASEYGMTELLSQAYARQDGRFFPAPTLGIYVSDLHLSSLPVPDGVSGRLHLIDLANAHSCAFIATEDIARRYPDGSFEVLGRIDTAELRGCNLLYA
ncbi:MAG: acyltransferase [Bacteroidia bacterium]